MFGRITLNEVIMIATSKIMKEVNLLAEQQQIYIDDIMEGKQAYNDVSHLLSFETKEKLRP